MKRFYLIFLLLPMLLRFPAAAQESPFFVTYTHHMEEPGNLDLEFSTTNGVPRSDQRAYVAPYIELEYGVTARWTSELYLESQSTSADSSVFTGWRWENRYKVLGREHWINPVLYIEYEDLNEASRIQKEIEGGGPDLTSPNALLTPTRDHELEGKLILSSDYHDWNISENFTLGAEVYGGLGSTLDFGLHDTAHYFAPVLSWAVSDNSTLRLSPGVGLTHQTNPVLIRFGYTYEIQGFTQHVAKLFGRRP